MRGSMPLDEFSRRFRMLEVRCANCLRHGRLRIDTLIEKYGQDMTLYDLRTLLAGDCEHKNEARRARRCKVFYPQLREMRLRRPDPTRLLSRENGSTTPS